MIRIVLTIVDGTVAFCLMMAALVGKGEPSTQVGALMGLLAGLFLFNAAWLWRGVSDDI